MMTLSTAPILLAEMSPGATKLIIIGCYLGLLLFLGLFASRLFSGSKSDYMLASHSIGPFLLLMSLFGTTMTAFALVGSTGESFKAGVGVYGLLASSSGIIHSLCFFLLGIPLWRLGRKHGYTTQIQFFRDRLGSDKIGILLFPILVGLVIPYLLIGVISGGAVVSGVTAGTFEPDAGFYAAANGGVAKWLAALVICGVVLVYVFFGGMRGTAWANAFQTSVFMVLGLVTFIVIARKLGAAAGLDESAGLLDCLRAASESIPKDHLNRSEHFGKLQFATYLFIPLSVGMFPHLFQHWLTAKSDQSFKLPVVVHPVFIMIVWVPCVLIGSWAAGSLVTAPPPVQANANLVLPFLVGKFAGPVLGGFLTAGILAAIMSSLDSQFLCLGTMFTEDIAVHYGGEGRFSDGQVVKLARWFIIGIVALTYGCSLLEPRAVFTLGVWCFSGFAALFPLPFLALYWRGLSKIGAYAGVLAAFGTWLWLFIDADFAGNREYLLSTPVGEVMPVTAMIAASTVATIVVSLVTPKPSPERLARFFPPKSS